MKKRISKHTRYPEEPDILSIALEQSANVIVITNPSGDIEYVNRAFTVHTGYLPEEVLGKNPRILKSGFQPDSFYEQFWKTISSGKKWIGEFQNKKKNGEIYWESATITPVKNKQGRIIRFIAIKENITSRKLAEDALKASEERYRTLIANIPGIIYRCAFDREWTMNYISNAIEDLTGYKPEEFINNKKRTFASIIHAADRSRVHDTVIIGVENFQQYSIEYRIITHKNTVKWVSETGRPLYDQNGRIIWLDGVIFDITERVHVLDELRKAKSSAEEANKAKSEFLANISHEIRTPLNSVLGFADLLEDSIIDASERQYLEAIKTSGKNLLTLINDLLDLSKIESGKLSLHYEYFDLRKLLAEIKQIFEPRISQKNLDYSDYIDNAFPSRIYSDESRLRQILINLVGNAVKFTKEGSIQLRVDYQLGTRPDIINLKISVSDTGIGIPREAFGIIFESFRQQSRLDARQYEGTGLGLSITKKLTEALDGSVFLESTVNKGSTFSIFFPSIQVLKDAHTESQPADKDLVAGHRGKMILQDFTGRFLTEYSGFMPGIDFLEFFSYFRNPTDCLDEIIGVMVVTGIDHSIINEKLHYFKEDKLLKKMPLILLTETHSMEVNKQVRKIADLIIRMPVDVNILNQCIRQLITKFYPKAAIEVKTMDANNTTKHLGLEPALKKLQQDLYPRWQGFITKQPLKEIRIFANEIGQVGKTTTTDFLIEYSHQLIASIDDFNIELLRERLAHFPDLLKKFKSMVRDSD
jgi:PAS domain S-box-containing protein